MLRLLRYGPVKPGLREGNLKAFLTGHDGGNDEEEKQEDGREGLGALQDYRPASVRYLRKKQRGIECIQTDVGADEAGTGSTAGGGPAALQERRHVVPLAGR